MSVKTELGSKANINVSVTFRHTEPTEALKKYANEKVVHLLKKYISSPTEVHIILSVEKRDHIAEGRMHSKKYDLSAKGVTEDLYSAIDKMIDSITRQLRKQKERNVDHKHVAREAGL